MQDVPRPSSSAAGHSTGPAHPSASIGSPLKRKVIIRPAGYDEFVRKLSRQLDAAADPKRKILGKVYQFRELADSEANLEWLERLTDETLAGKFPTFGDFAVASGSIRQFDDETRRAAAITESEREEAARARLAATNKNTGRLTGRQSNLRVH